MQIEFCNTLLTNKTHFLWYNVIVNKVPLKLFVARNELKSLIKRPQARKKLTLLQLCLELTSHKNWPTARNKLVTVLQVCYR